VFGNKKVNVRVSTSKHLVVDLAEITWVDPQTARIVECDDPADGFPSFLTSEAARVATTDHRKSETAMPTGMPTQAAHAAKQVFAVDCKACRGAHRKHTCGKGTKSGSKPNTEPPKREEEMDTGPIPDQETIRAGGEDREYSTPVRAGGEDRRSSMPVRAGGDSSGVGGFENEELRTDRACGNRTDLSGETIEEEDDGSGPQPVVPVPNPNVPASLLKLHRRLSKEVELYKLHVKHYHMSTKQFRMRTTELALPEEVYEKFDKMVKTCKVCSESQPAPSRARVSGLRAQNFGDLVFLDHAKIPHGGQKYAVLLIRDGATNLLAAHPSAEEPHAVRNT